MQSRLNEISKQISNIAHRYGEEAIQYGNHNSATDQATSKSTRDKLRAGVEEVKESIANIEITCKMREYNMEDYELEIHNSNKQELEKLTNILNNEK